MITPKTQVRDIVLERPGAIPLLEQVGIYYRCGGKNTLKEACSSRTSAFRPFPTDWTRYSLNQPMQTGRRPVWLCV